MRWPVGFVVVASVVVVGCKYPDPMQAIAGGDGGIDGHPVDGSLDGGAHRRAFVTAGDFAATGLLSVLDVDAKTSSNNVAPGKIGGDPVLRRFGDELFVVNRDKANITILSAADYSVIETLDTGAGSNPQDVAVDGTHLYVPIYNGSGVVRLTRGTADKVTIDLSASDPDGKPNCASIFKSGARLYVTCQLLDNATFAPRSNGKVYVIATTNDSIVAALTLSSKNPQSLIEELPLGGMNAGSLVVGTYDYGTAMGCIEMITTGTTPTAPGCLFNLGGFVSRITTAPTTTPSLFALVVRSDFSGGDIRRIDLSNLALDGGHYSQAGQALQDIAACSDGRVIAAEGPSQGQPAGPPEGLRIYTAANTEATTAPIAVGIDPASAHELFCE